MNVISEFTFKCFGATVDIDITPESQAQETQTSEDDFDSNTPLSSSNSSEVEGSVRS
jgi:hypothetical protein